MNEDIKKEIRDILEDWHILIIDGLTDTEDKGVVKDLTALFESKLIGELKKKPVWKTIEEEEKDEEEFMNTGGADRW
jgi:hypothetical protein